MNKWDERFIKLAHHIGEWSKDPSAKVGAVIVDQNNRVVSLGYNGFPRGVEDDPAIYADRAEKYRRVIHAETNALLFTNQSLKGCTLYCNYPPCAQCTAKAIQAGITRIVFDAPDAEFLTRWTADLQTSAKLCTEAGIECEIFYGC